MGFGATAVLLSKQYILLYFVVVFFNYLQLVWFVMSTVFGEWDTLSSPLMFTLEVTTTAFMFLEIFLVLLGSGPRKFFRSWALSLDFTLLVVSIVVLVLSVILPQIWPHDKDVDAACVVSRFVVQQLRLVSAIKNQYRNFNVRSRVSVSIIAAPVPSHSRGPFVLGSSSSGHSLTEAVAPPSPQTHPSSSTREGINTSIEDVAASPGGRSSSALLGAQVASSLGSMPALSPQGSDGAAPAPSDSVVSLHDVFLDDESSEESDDDFDDALAYGSHHSAITYGPIPHQSSRSYTTLLR